MQPNEKWDLIIEPRNKWYKLDLASVWKYRDLLMLLVRRDFVSVYKQTVLGPVWFIIQPLLTSFTFTIIFSGFGHMSTDSLPGFLFYLAGITLWTYFADCLNKTSNTFVANSGVFGKVYFPRLIVPLSVLISNLIKLGVQMLLFTAVWMYYIYTTNTVHPHWQLIWLFPVLVIMMAFLGFGFGIFISSVTTKYRDFTFLIGFGVQLLMYASSIIFPLNEIKKIHPEYVRWLLLNPVSSIIEWFKYIFLGNGYPDVGGLLYSAVFMLVLLIISVIVFNKVEKTFMDTV